LKLKAPNIQNSSKIPQGQYELIGGTPTDLQAAKAWAAFWGHEISPQMRKCGPGRNRIPATFKQPSATLFFSHKSPSRVKF
jgi:hypothetical protein